MRCKTKNLKPTNMRFITTVTLCLFIFSASAQKVVDKIVGVVNDKIILLSDIEAQYLQYAQEYGANIPENLRCDLLDQAMTPVMLLKYRTRLSNSLSTSPSSITTLSKID